MIRALALAILAVPASAACADGVEFEAPSVDLGKVRAAGTIEHRFRYTVKGDSPVEVVDVRPSCGCLRTEVVRRTWQPGETGVVPLRIHATSQSNGRKRFELRLTVREPRERTIVLTAEMDLESELSVRPSNLIVHLQPGQKTTQEVVVADRRPGVLQIVGVDASSPAITAKLLPGKPGENVRRIAVEVSGDVPEGGGDQRLLVRTRDAELASFEIPITIVRSRPIEVRPTTVVVPKAATGVVERRVILWDRTGGATVAAATCAQAGVRCSWRREGNMVHEISLQIDPGTPSTELRLRLGDAAGTELVVPIRAE